MTPTASRPSTATALGRSALQLTIFTVACGTGMALGGLLAAAAPASAKAGLIAEGLWNRFLRQTASQGGSHLAELTEKKLKRALAKALARRWQKSDAAFAQPELSTCMGEAIASVLNDLSKDLAKIPAADDRKTLSALANDAARRWARIAAFPATAHQSEEELEGVVTGHLVSAQQGGDPLSAADWEPILERLLSASFELSDEAFKRTTEELATRTGVQFLHILQDDAANGGPRFAAGLFASLGQIRSESQAIQAALENHFEEIAQSLAEMESEAGWRHRTVIRRLRKLDDKRSGKLDEILGALSFQLSLDERAPLPPTARTLTQTFRAQQRAIPLFGRDPELTRLESWLDDERPVAITLITGKAGTGKTRLAQELCDAVRGEGWHVGQIGSSALDTFIERAPANWIWSQPTLIVIDYAASRCEQIGKLLDLVASRRSDTSPVLRILLLERHRGADEAALPRLFGDLSGESHQDRNNWHNRDDEIQLDGFGAQPAVLHQILAASIALVPLRNDAPTTSPEDVERLAQAIPSLHLDESTPLLLQLAVHYRQSIVGEGDGGQTIHSRHDLLRTWWQEEERGIRRHAEANQLAPETLQALVVLACLRGSLPADPVELAELAQAECQRWALDSPPAGAELRRILTASLGLETKPEDPDSEPQIPSLMPGLMAEYAVFDRFQKQSSPYRSLTRLREWLAHHADEREDQVGAFLVRLCADLYDARDDQRPGSPQAWRFLVDEDPAATPPTPTTWWDERTISTLLAAEQSLPNESVELSELRLRILLALDDHEQQPPPAEKIRQLNHLSIAHSEVGNRGDALERARAAERMSQELPEPDSDTTQASRASAQNNLGERLSELGRYEDALHATQEAAEIRRRLAKRALGAYGSNLVETLNNLAGTLNNLGARYFDCGRAEKALGATQESVDIYKELAERWPHTFEPNYAGALTNLGIWLADQPLKDALGVTQEATNIFGRLAKPRPDAFEPHLASALTNLGRVHYDLDQSYAALNETSKALAIRRKLASRQPLAFMPNLAASCGTMGVILRKLNPEGSVAVYEEGLQAILPLLQRGLEAHAPLARALWQGWLKSAEKAGATPDPELLTALITLLTDGEQPE